MAFNAAALARRRRFGGAAGATLLMSLLSTTATFAAASQPHSMSSDPFVASITPTVAKGLDGSFDYYIDATNGSDGNAGTSEGAAWASLNKINALTLTGSPSYRILVKSDSYDTASDFISVATGESNWSIEIVFEPGCIIDGTNYTTQNAIEFDGPANLTYGITIYGNGLVVRNVTTATGNGYAPAGGASALYDVVFNNCRDNITTKGDGSYTINDCVSLNALKFPFTTAGTATLVLNRCYISDGAATATLGGLISFFNSGGSNTLNDCVIIPGSTLASRNINGGVSNSNATFNNCQIGTLTAQCESSGTATNLTFNNCFVNHYGQLNATLAYNSCYGKLSFRQRNGGGLTMENCVISGPATGSTSVFFSNFNPGSGSPHYVRDNIFETASAAAFMSYDATNAGYVVAAGSEFFNNILSGSAAYDADLIAADTGGTVIVDNVTSDALIGAANTLDPADYGYAAGSPAIGAGVSGGNCGFSVASPPALPTKPDNQFTCEIDISDGGTFTLGRTDGLRFTEGDGTADAAMTFIGAIGNINAALAAATLQNFTAGSRTATAVITQDKTALTDTETLTITVT